MKIIASALWLVALCASNCIAADPVKIGSIAPVTGPFAAWGRSIETGVRIAAEDSAHPLAIDYQDDSCEPAKAVSAANKILNVTKARIIIGPGCVDGLKAVAPIAARANAVVFSTGLLDDSVLHENSNVINLAGQIAQEGHELADYLKRRGVKHLALIHGSNVFGEEFARILKENLPVVMSEATPFGTSDFRPLILRALAKKPDGIFVHQGTLEICALLHQLRAVDKRIQVFSQYGVEADSILPCAGDAAEGLEYSFPSTGPEEKSKEFNERFRKVSSAEPSPSSLYAYDGVSLITAAAAKCGGNDGACITAFFKNLGRTSGLSGTMVFTAEGAVLRRYGIKKVSSGKFVWIERPE